MPRWVCHFQCGPTTQIQIKSYILLICMKTCPYAGKLQRQLPTSLQFLPDPQHFINFLFRFVSFVLICFLGSFFPFDVLDISHRNLILTLSASEHDHLTWTETTKSSHHSQSLSSMQTSILILYDIITFGFIYACQNSNRRQQTRKIENQEDHKYII